MSSDHQNRKRAVFSTPIPYSSDDCIVFPFDKALKQFDTSYYSPSETNNKCQVEEIEKFLDDITVPYLEWYRKYGYLFDGSTGLSCLLVICFILMPLMFVFACWLSSAQNKAMEKHDEMAEKTKALIRATQQNFIDKGLLWHVPAEFPLWIELCTKVQGPEPWSGGEVLGIKMMALPQDSYPSVGPSPRQPSPAATPSNKVSSGKTPKNKSSSGKTPKSKNKIAPGSFTENVAPLGSPIKIIAPESPTKKRVSPAASSTNANELTSPSIRVYNEA